jgi:hypothetical protein
MQELVPAGPDDPLWWTLRRPFRRLTYHAARAMFVRTRSANPLKVRLSVMPVHSQTITVGNPIVGAVSIDGGAVRGEGGPIRPQLVVPLKLQLNPTPENAQLAVCYVSAPLSTDQNASPHAAVCQRVSATLMDNFNARSIPHGPVDHTIQPSRLDRMAATS